MDLVERLNRQNLNRDALMELGNLEKVDLRVIWDSESGSFTPWLAQDENLKLLGKTIVLELELESTEKDVGPFRADILCRDTATGDWVLIENQLERTDHVHLGQLLTYAAGLEAVTVVWIAQRFTDEHRAALDWLNNITSENVSFFGLEIELWRIGDSPPAPKFNIVSKPNEWTKRPTSGPLTETQQMQLEFWSGFREHLMERRSFIKSQKPAPQSWTAFSIGRSGFQLGAAMHTRELWLRASVDIWGQDAFAYFQLLKRDKETFEPQLGMDSIWRARTGGKSCNIYLERGQFDLADRDRWSECQEWLADKLETLHRVFSDRIKRLDAGQYVPTDEEHVDETEG